VGVLETTTQDLDARIAEMGRWIHPEHADGPWLDYLARWLDLPWDDSLEIAQKRCIVRSAARIIRGRGTRAGLEALLACLLPGDPRPYRVIDVAADLGFAIVGDRSCQGSAISSILAGSRRRMSTLDRHAILGRMHLACEGPLDDDPWSPVRGIRIDIAASAQQRRALEPWLPALAGSMVPATVRTELRWVAPQALHGDRIDDALELGGPPDARLGDDAVLGVARLPEGRAVLSESGPTTDTRLH
jgi:phage tail-like protein